MAKPCACVKATINRMMGIIDAVLLESKWLWSAWGRVHWTFGRGQGGKLIRVRGGHGLHRDILCDVSNGGARGFLFFDTHLETLDVPDRTTNPCTE